MILGLAGVQQKQQQKQRRQSPLRVRPCLYCQQVGCRGIQSCWWPRARPGRSTSTLRSRVEPVPSSWNNTSNYNNNSGSAVEENLRMQINVLEREVQLLRNELHSITVSNGLQGQQPSAEHLPYWKSKDSRMGKVSVPSCVVIPPATQGATQRSFQEEKDTAHAVMPQVSEKPPLPFVLPEKTEPQREEHLEKLVLQLVAQNTTLCRKLAEATSVLEQRDALLLSLFSERPALVPSPSHPATVQTSSSFASPHEREMTVMTQLLQKQREIAHLQEEMRDLKGLLDNSREDLQHRAEEVEFLRSQVVQLSTLQKSTGVGLHSVHATAPSFNTDPIQASSQPMAESTITKSTEEKSNKGIFVIPYVAHNTAGVDTKVASTEVCELREKLAAAERKILAWESWYQQEQQKQRRESSSLQTSEGLVQENYCAPPTEEPRVSVITAPKPQEHPQILLRALPVSGPIHRLSQPSADLSRPGGCTADILALDTYALISSESALREAAKQERRDLMAALL